MEDRTLTGIVTRTYAYRENDLLVHGVSPQLGRFSVVARGAKKSQKRFAGLLATFNELELHVSWRTRVPTLESAVLLRDHPRLGQDWPRFCQASCLAELAESFSAEDHADPAIHAALARTLDRMESGEPDPRGFPGFMLEILHAAGVAPHTRGCLRCGGTGAARLHRWSLRDGGLLCVDCLRPEDRADTLMPLSPPAMAFLTGGTPLEPHTGAELQRLLGRFAAFQLGRELRSARWLG